MNKEKYQFLKYITVIRTQILPLMRSLAGPNLKQSLYFEVEVELHIDDVSRLQKLLNNYMKTRAVLSKHSALTHSDAKKAQSMYGSLRQSQNIISTFSVILQFRFSKVHLC